MRGNKTFAIIGGVLLVIVLIGGGAYFASVSGLLGGPAAEETPMGTEFVPQDYTEIVVSAQDISLGMQIKIDDFAVQLQSWPNEYLPETYYTSIEEVDGKFARTSIPRGMPVMPEMIAREGGGLSFPGSSAALFSQKDRVAYAIPMDTQGAVAWALRAGDHVDVITAFEMVARSSEATTGGLNQFTYLEEKELPGQTNVYGRFEQLPNGRWAAIYSAEQSLISEMFPLLLVQLTVQDAIVWHVGVWEQDQEIETETAPTPVAADAGGSGAMTVISTQPEETPIPQVSERRDVEPITLLVSREDALVLKYLYEMGADMDLILRPAGFTDVVIQTQPVWFRYLVERYQLPDVMPDIPISSSALRFPLELLPLATPEPAE